MKKLELGERADFNHWLRQRYLYIVMLTVLLEVDTVMTWLFAGLYKVTYEQNPYMAAVLELPYGYAILALLKLPVLLLMSWASWHAYKGLHSDKQSETAKRQAHKVEVWLWYFTLGLSGVLDIIMILNFEQFIEMI